MATQTSQLDPAVVEAEVLEIVRELLREAGRGDRAVHVTVNSFCKRDLGVASLELVELMVRCEAALRNPVWGIWLGRKCCIPASPVYQGLFDSREAALDHLRSLPNRKDREPAKTVREIVEVDRFDEGSDTLMDRPVCFAKREFLPRRVRNDPCPED